MKFEFRLSAHNYAAFNLLSVLFPTISNPFYSERTLWQMGYFSCSRPPTSIAATHPYRPGGHMCSAPPWRSAGKGHGDTPACCSLLSSTIQDMAKHWLCHSSWQAPPKHKKRKKSIPPLCIVSKLNKIWFATCGQNRWFSNWVFSSQ